MGYTDWYIFVRETRTTRGAVDDAAARKAVEKVLKQNK